MRPLEQNVRAYLLEQLKRVIDSVRPRVLVQVLFESPAYSQSMSIYKRPKVHGDETHLVEGADGSHEDDRGPVHEGKCE